MQSRPICVVGNPENRRVRFFQDALGARGLPPAEVLPYRDLLSGRRSIEDIPPRSIVRIDSPGENFEVEKQLLELGETAAGEEGSPVIEAAELAGLEFDRGRILHPRQWYLGFRAALQAWEQALASRPDIGLASNPADIARMFDKTACGRDCAEKGIPVPEPLGPVSGYDELIARMQASERSRVFVKLAHGSSASGVVAFEFRRGKAAAITTTEMVVTRAETLLYNSLRIRRYTKQDEVRRLIDALAAHRVHVEEWLPKAAVGGKACDIRVVLIAGCPRHLVVRTSRGPFTNLHLGNRRGNREEFLNRLGADGRDSLDATCAAVASVFARSLQMGVDILYTPGFRRFVVLEVNAFGDLLPGVGFEGKSTYETQVDAMAASFGNDRDASRSKAPR